MAKSKNTKTTQTRTTARPHQKPVATTQVVPTFTPSPKPLVTPKPVLKKIEDRRTFHPEKANRPALDIWGKKAAVKLINKARPTANALNLPKQVRQKRQAIINRFGEKFHSQTKAIRAFAVPTETIICIRRKVRKQVLAAKKKIGLGGRQKHPKLNWTSKIACRS